MSSTSKVVERVHVRHEKVRIGIEHGSASGRRVRGLRRRLRAGRATAGVQPGTEPVVFRLSRSTPVVERSGGRIQVADSTNFTIARTIATALVPVEPGGMREMHWHPNADEWQYYLGAEARTAYTDRICRSRMVR